MRYIFLIVLLSMGYNVGAQYILEEFSTTVLAHDLKVAEDGDYFLAGFSEWATEVTGIVAKYDSTGTLLWESKWGNDLHAVGDLVYSQGRLFGAVSGWEGDEWVFELDTETGAVLWQSPIETHRQRDGAWGGIDAEIWLDHGHVMVNSWYSSSWGIDIRRIYCFEQDSGTLLWYEDYYSSYGLPRDMTVGKADEYPMPFGYSADSLIIYSFSQNHQIKKTNFPYFQIDSNGIYIRWDKFDTRLRKLAKDSTVIYDQPFEFDTFLVNQILLNHSAQFKGKIIFSGLVDLADDTVSSWFQTVFDLKSGTQIWDTLMPLYQDYELRDLAYANGYLYSWGYFLDSNRIYHPKVYRLNADFWETAEEEEELPKEEFSLELYPNPASSLIHVTYESVQEITMGIYSVTGALVLEMQTNPSNEPIDITHLPVGMYILQVKTEQLVQSKKFIIVR